MAGGSFTAGGAVDKERAEQYKGRVTAYVIIACIVAATGGSLFGYDIGISGLSSIHALKSRTSMVFYLFPRFRLFFISYSELKTQMAYGCYRPIQHICRPKVNFEKFSE